MINEILLAAYFRKNSKYNYDHFLTALLEYRDGQSLDYWLPKLTQHHWRQNLIWQLSQGVRFIYPSHDLYPQQLQQMSDPPLLLSYLGSPVWMHGQGLAVVGSREPHSQSLTWMNEVFSDFLKLNNAYIVSGGARGVDQKAHALAVMHNCPTIAMIPSGLGAIYPKDFKGWLPSIIENGGAIVSEYPYHQKMQKHFFQARNRLIAGFGRATLLVEAGRRSGTLITARQCLEQGRPLWVVPSHPMDVGSRGGLDLMQEGATPVCDAKNLISFFDSEVRDYHFYYQSRAAFSGQAKDTPTTPRVSLN